MSPQGMATSLFIVVSLLQSAHASLVNFFASLYCNGISVVDVPVCFLKAKSHQKNDIG